MKVQQVKKSGIKIAQFFISLSSWILIFPPFLLGTLCNEFVRLCMYILLKIKHGSQYSLVRHGADNIWHCKVAGNSRTCLLIGVTKDKFDINKYTKRFETEVLGRIEPDEITKTYCKLKKTFVRKFGYYCLRDDSETFNISNHIKLYDGVKPKDGRENYTEEEFFQSIVPKLAEDMDESKPQWENILISKVKFKDHENISSVLCHRWHHSLMDSISMMTMNNYCMRDKDRIKSLEKSMEFNPMVSLPIKKYERFLVKSYALIMTPYLILEVFLRTWRTKSRFSGNSYSGKRHYGWSEQIDYNLIREVKGSSGAKHISAVLATALASALSKMQLKCPREQDSEQLPTGLLNAMLPYKNIKPRNRVTATQINIPTSKMTWNMRMGKINQQFQKLDPNFFAFFYLSRWVGRLPWWMLEFCFKSGVGGGIQHATFSPIPVGMKNWHVVGCRFKDAGSWTILYMHNGIAVTTLRFADNIRYCLVVDDDCMNREELDYCLQQILVEIRDMVYYCRQKSFVLIGK